MKQGSGREGGYRKREPVVHSISPGGVGQLGNIQGNHVTNKGDSSYHGEPLHQGRGFMAPRNKSQSSTNRGSQGRY